MLNLSPIDDTLRALAEPTRRAIVERLSQKPATVSDLAKPFDMSFAAVVQHLQVLEASGLIASEKVEPGAHPAASTPRGLAPLADWIEKRRNIVERQLDRLGEFLEETNPSKQTLGKIKKERKK